MNIEEQKVEISTESDIVCNTVLAEVPDHGMCKDRNCKDKTTIDYNGHGHWVCRYHYDKLSDYFDEKYR